MHVCRFTTADDSTPTLGVLDDTVTPLDVEGAPAPSNRVGVP